VPVIVPTLVAVPVRSVVVPVSVTFSAVDTVVPLSDTLLLATTDDPENLDKVLVVGDPDVVTVPVALPATIGMASRDVPLLVKLTHPAIPPEVAGIVDGVYPLIVGVVEIVNDDEA